MKAPNSLLESFLIVLIFSALFSVGCSTVKVDSKAAETARETSADPEIDKLLARVEDAPGAADGYIQLASVYIRRGREKWDSSFSKKAQAAIDRALVLEPGNVKARQLNTALLANAHRFVDARNAAQALTTEFPDDSFAYGILVDANVELGNYDEAITAAQKMVDLKPNSASYARVGHIRSLLGDHKGAIEMLTTAARTADPLDKEAQSWCLMQLGKEQFMAGDLEKALKIIDESLQISPEYPLSLIEKARFIAAKGDLDGAETILRRLDERVRLTEASIMLGDISMKRGNLDAAKQQYALAEETERTGGGDIHRFALLWADLGERSEEALNVAETDYQTNKDVYGSDILAWCLLKNGRPNEAQVKIREALKLGTKDAKLYYHAGMIEKALGNRGEARRLIALALKTNPYFDLLQAAKAREVLAELL